MSGNAYNPYGRQQQPQTLGTGYQTQPAYYSPSYGVGTTGYQTQPKAYDGGRVYGNQGQGYQAGSPQYQNQPLETYDGEVHYHPATNEDFCCSLGCLLAFDLLALVLLIVLFINSALKNWGWWFVVGFLVILAGLCIYLLVVACGTNRTNGTKSAFNAYHILRIITGVCTLILGIIYLIIAIILWSYNAGSGDKSIDALAGAVASAIAWLLFVTFLIFLAFGLWFLVTIGSFRKAIDRNHQNGSSLPY